MFYIKFGAECAKDMMNRKDSDEIISYVYAKIMVAAFKGECGCEISIPIEDCGSIDFVTDILVDDGFTVTTGTVTQEHYVFEVYWAID